MAEKTFKSGEVILREKTYVGCMYELLEGTVGVYANYGQSDEKLLTELKAENGAYFGEMGFVEARLSSATVAALSDVRVEVIMGTDFAAFFTEHPEQIYAIMTQMGSRIRGLTQDYLDVCHAASELVETKGSSEKRSNFFTKSLERIRNYLNSEEFQEGLKLAPIASSHLHQLW